MLKTQAALSLALALVPGPVRATTDGPDVYRVVNVARDDMLNLRRGPGTRSAVIVGLPPGRQVNLLSREPNGWCLISMRETPQLQGYVNCRFIGE
jgi:uncharacterized protein YgiM (DUF1202 family)